ncbi:MAG: HDOD domain-containing protein [Candidatus Krumholzibacteria bacterium]|nr:HDOD domain-containing protein [Candidatus Krumholzibacteria bacterium]
MRSFCIGDRVIDSGQLQAMLSNFEELPTIPDILFHILKILDDPDSGAADLAEVVRLDVPLTARILRLANSPYYSTRGDMGDIHRCIAVLGYRTIRQVAICVSVATSVVSAAGRAQGDLDYKELWRHSVATGAISKNLAEMTGYPAPEEVFTAGLLHDLGKFVLEIYSPCSYGKVISARKRNGMSLLESEREAYGFDHAVLGEAFGFSWRFPGMLTRCLGHHHDLLTKPCVTGSEEHAVSLVALADYLAHTLVPAKCDLGFDADSLNVKDLHMASGLTMEEVSDQEETLRNVVSKSSIYLDIR